MKIKKKIISLSIITLGVFLIFFVFGKSGFYDIEDFNIEYNNIRIENNIPILDPSWKVNNKMALTQYYNTDSISYGYIKKYININKSYVGSERDVFKTKNYIILSLFERNDKNKVLYKVNDLKSIFSSEKEVINSKEANRLLKESNIGFQFNKSWDRLE